MADETPVQTPSPESAGTPTPPANPADDKGASQPPTNGAGATPDEETVTLKKKDYNNLLSQRDKANNDKQSQDAFLGEIAQERYISDFLAKNKEKYPDISAEDLKHVLDPEQMDAEAARLQDRLNSHAQAKLLEIENPTPVRETPDERNAREAELKKKPGKDTLAKVFAGRMR